MRAERARALIPSLSKIRASDSPERTVRLCQGDASGTEAIGVTSAAAVELGGEGAGRGGSQRERSVKCAGEMHV